MGLAGTSHVGLSMAQIIENSGILGLYKTRGGPKINLQCAEDFLINAING